MLTCVLLLSLGTVDICPDYEELSLGVHSERLDAPEVIGMGTLLFTGTIGYNIMKGTRHSLAAELTHVSGVTTYEQGYGLNTIGIRYRYER